MRRDATARLTQVANVGKAIARRLLDTNPVPVDWTHVTKVDPEEAKELPLLFPRWLQHTDAISVGGSRDVTAANTEATFDLLEPLTIPVCHEPSGPRQVTDRSRRAADLLLVPEVLNGDVESLVGKLGTAVEYVREELVPDLLAEELPWLPAALRDPLADVATTALLSEAAFEAYIVQNPDSAAAREAGVTADDLLSPTEARRRAIAADRHLDSEIVYLEYSGTFGGEEATAILRELDGALTRSRIWYGGGLADAAGVRAVRDAGADTVVVGDAFHDVAAAERDLLADAEMALAPDAGDEDVADWVTERLDDDWPGARYLATTGVVAPAKRAHEHAIATVQAWLDLRAVETGLGTDTTASAVRRAVERADLRLARELDPAFDDPEAATDLAQTLATGVLGAQKEINIDDGIDRATTHLGVPGAR